MITIRLPNSIYKIRMAYSRAIKNNETEITTAYTPLDFHKSEWMDTQYQETMGL